MAAGDNLFWVPAAWGIAPASSGAGETSINTTSPQVVKTFLNGVLRYTVFPQLLLPRHYGGGGINTYIWWSTSATTNDVDFDGQFERSSSIAATGDSWATAQSVINEAPSGTANIPKSSLIQFTNSQIAGVLAGELFRFRLARRGDVDTVTVPVLVYGIEFRETP